MPPRSNSRLSSLELLAAAGTFVLPLLALPQTPAPAVKETPIAPAATVAASQESSQQRTASWYFAVSGDSRDCGDLIVPKIAESIRVAKQTNDIRFFWHLGDFRSGWRADEDFKILRGSDDRYRDLAWRDFKERQLLPLAAQTKVYLGIGNHDVIRPWSIDRYKYAFASCLGLPAPSRPEEDDYDADSPQGPACPDPRPEITAQRETDDEAGIKRDRFHADYHFKVQGVDFISLDNSDAVPSEILLAEDFLSRSLMPNSRAFTAIQIEWLKRVLRADRDDPSVKSVVVGMHMALPGSSASGGHAMDRDKHARDSGGKVYNELYDFETGGGKPVYVFASHSHEYKTDVFRGGHLGRPLNGWIIGTAGAVQPRLPIRYGYILAEVTPTGEIRPEFVDVTRDSKPAPANTKEQRLTKYCFTMNVRATRAQSVVRQAPPPNVPR